MAFSPRGKEHIYDKGTSAPGPRSSCLYPGNPQSLCLYDKERKPGRPISVKNVIRPRSGRSDSRISDSRGLNRLKERRTVLI
jgi:hypothetical protein